MSKRRRKLAQQRKEALTATTENVEKIQDMKDIGESIKSEHVTEMRNIHIDTISRKGRAQAHSQAVSILINALINAGYVDLVEEYKNLSKKFGGFHYE